MESRRRRQPPKYNAVVASARLMQTKPAGMRRKVKGEQWESDAWMFYDVIPELRFGVGWIANGLSRVNLVGATAPVSAGDEPSVLRAPLPDQENPPTLSKMQREAMELVAAIAGDANGQAAMMQRLAVLLSVAGVGWALIESESEDDPAEKWTWRILSNDELKGDLGEYEVADPDVAGGWRKLAGQHLLVKVWRSHPRAIEQADSAVRAALPVLRQIALLDDHILATAQSRLAGAGILVLPKEIDFEPVLKKAPDPEADEADDDGDFVDVLIDSMTTPIGDRGVAAAVVPLVIKIPGEYVDKVRHITFWSEFSEVVPGLREAGVKRLALGLDMPPEVVTGVSGMNHWGAWRVQEEAITLHIIPLAEIICEALTIGYLRPALLAAGYSEDEVRTVMVFFDITDLVARPDKSADYGAAYDRIEVSGEGYRREIGAPETDKPTEEERQRRILLRVLDRAPDLAADILPLLGVNIVITDKSNDQKPDTATERDAEPNVGEQPDTEDRRADETRDDAREAAALEAADGLVYRALERAGQRLRTAASRNVPRAGGGPAVDHADSTTLHTVLDAASFADLNALLAGAWERVPVVAARLSVDPDRLTAALDGYVRSLIVTAKPHDHANLARVLSSEAA